MSRLTSRPAASVLFLIVAMVSGVPAILADGPPASARQYPCEENWIEVMFEQGSRVRLRGGPPVDLSAKAMTGVEQALQEYGPVEWHRICNLPEERLDEIQARGEARTGQRVYNMNNIYRLRVPQGLDIWDVSRKLEALPGIHFARPVPKPTPLPYPSDFQPQQGYQDPAPTGIDAEYAWTRPGGDGAGVTVCDIEYSWTENHEDLTKAPNSQINPNTLVDPFNDPDHGTAVLGEMVSDNNGWGTTGICYGSDLKTCGTYWIVSPTETTWNVAGAIAYAIDSLSAGDVIVLEHQWDYGDPNTSHTDFIPIEWWGSTYPSAQTTNTVWVAIFNAVSAGIIVVECGGNGGAPTPNSGYNTDNLTWWFQSSGAIIVGAGGQSSSGTYPEGNLERISWSSYGSRYDLQGWGEDVVTTGYGDFHWTEGESLWYTNGFSGTSSAAPIVAGAAACCVGHWTAAISSTPPTPAELLTILVSTGTAQVFGPAGNIGPRPDLDAAFAAFPQWVDATPALLEDPERAIGVAWGDYDGDQDPDLYVTDYSTPSSNKLFRNQGGGSFSDATSGPLAGPIYGSGAFWGDYDNDGDLDIYVASGVDTNRLHRNDGGGTFTDVACGALAEPGASWNGPWGDYDNDGDIDVYLTKHGPANKLFRNDGGGSFADATSGPLGVLGFSRGVVWGDYDNDGDLDLYVVNDNSANKLLRNDGGGTFVDATSAPLDHSWDGVGAAWGDYDNDGDLDLYITNCNQANCLFRNDGGGTFVDVAGGGPLANTGCSVCGTWGDYDNDGDLDLYLTNSGTANCLFRNDGGGTFVEVAAGGPLAVNGSSQSAAWADYDGDGDIDLYLAIDGGANKLFRNTVGSDNHWLHVDLVGTTSNRAGIGARVRVVTGGTSQIREVSGGSAIYSQNSLTAEFGLGSTATVDSVIVTWPSGATQDSLGIAADQRIVLEEPATSDVEDVAVVAGTFRLDTSYPNPFHAGTTIRYELPEPGIVNLRVFDVSGRLVRILADRAEVSAGLHRVTWDGKDRSGHSAAPGVYFYRIAWNGKTETRRMVLLK